MSPKYKDVHNLMKKKNFKKYQTGVEWDTGD